MIITGFDSHSLQHYNLVQNIHLLNSEPINSFILKQIQVPSTHIPFPLQLLNEEQSRSTIVSESLAVLLSVRTSLLLDTEDPIGEEELVDLLMPVSVS